MKVELHDMDAGFRKLKKRPSPADFGVSDFRCFCYKNGEMVEVATADKLPEDGPLYTLVDTGQWELVVDGMQWGYVMKNRDHISLIRRVTDEIKEELKTEIAKLTTPKTKVSMPVELPAEDGDDDDEATDE